MTLEMRLKDSACADEVVDADHGTPRAKDGQAKQSTNPQESCLMYRLLFGHGHDRQKRDCQCRQQ